MPIVSGRVTRFGLPIAGVQMVGLPGPPVLTDTAGNWSATIANGSYTITPTLGTLTFFPPTRSFTLPPDAVEQSFLVTGSPPTPPAPPPPDTLVMRVLAVMDGPTVIAPELWFSTATFTTGTGDTPANTLMDGRLLGDVRYTRKVAPIFWDASSNAAVPIGSASLANPDSTLDGLLRTLTRDRVVEFFRGSPSIAFASWAMVARTTIESIDADGERTLTVTFGSVGASLQKPIQGEVYTAGNAAINGRPRPIAYGECLNVPALLVSTSNLDYDVHDAPPLSIVRVRSNGAEMTPTTDWVAIGNGFRLLKNPASTRITADVRGHADASVLADTVGTIVPHLLARVGLGLANWNAASAVGLSRKMQYWTQGPDTAARVLSQLMDGYGGWWWVDNLNRVNVGRLTRPGTPAMTIDYQIVGDIKPRFDRAPGFADVVASRRNWHVNTPAEIAGTLISPTITQTALDLQADYRVRVRATTAPVGGVQPGYGYEIKGAAASRDKAEVLAGGLATLLTDAGDTQACANDNRELYPVGKMNRFVDFDAVVDAVAIEIGMTVRLISPRYGFSAGRNVVIVGIDGGLLPSVSTLTVWDPEEVL